MQAGFSEDLSKVYFTIHFSVEINALIGCHRGSCGFKVNGFCTPCRKRLAVVGCNKGGIP